MSSDMGRDASFEALVREQVKLIEVMELADLLDYIENKREPHNVSAWKRVLSMRLGASKTGRAADRTDTSDRFQRSYDLSSAPGFMHAIARR